jgi:hypothetical protein
MQATNVGLGEPVAEKKNGSEGGSDRPTLGSKQEEVKQSEAKNGDLCQPLEGVVKKPQRVRSATGRDYGRQTDTIMKEESSDDDDGHFDFNCDLDEKDE